MKDIFDTIVAISTPPGVGGISIIKVSGKNAVEIAKRVFCLPFGSFPQKLEPRKVYYGYIKSLQDNHFIDECLMLYMASPKSYTGEDIIEFQCHGGNINTVLIVEEILKNKELVRYADPGEFTYRAFLNGKKDLVQAESVEALIHSRTEFQHDNASKLLSGKLTKRLNEIFKRLNEIRLYVEAELNFPEDIENNEINVDDLINDSFVFFEDLLNSYKESITFTKGITAAIVGKPNVGKSSFLNKLLDNERAIVTPYPGTTRDTIEETIILEGVPLKIVDTAGIRETQDPIEKIGIDRAKTLIHDAHIIFALFDISQDLSEEDKFIIDLLPSNKLVFAILNKIDKGVKISIDFLPQYVISCPISLLTGEGFDNFTEVFRNSILKVYTTTSKREFYLTQPRHYEIVSAMFEIVKDLKENKFNKEKLLFALNDLYFLYEKLLGRVTTEDDINKIFSKFCIGK